jgi:hypothetical protein
VFKKKIVRSIFASLSEKVKGGRKNLASCNFLVNAVTKFCCDDEMEEEFERNALRKKEKRKPYTHTHTHTHTHMLDGKYERTGSLWRSINVDWIVVVLEKVCDDIILYCIRVSFVAVFRECGNETLSFLKGANIVD